MADDALEVGKTFRLELNENGMGKKKTKIIVFPHFIDPSLIDDGLESSKEFLESNYLLFRRDEERKA